MNKIFTLVREVEGKKKRRRGQRWLDSDERLPLTVRLKSKRVSFGIPRRTTPDI